MALETNNQRCKMKVNKMWRSLTSREFRRESDQVRLWKGSRGFRNKETKMQNEGKLSVEKSWFSIEPDQIM